MAPIGPPTEQTLMDLSTVSSAFQGLTYVKDTFSAIQQLKVDVATLGKVNEALRKVDEAQSAIFGLREQLFTLQTERERLQRELDARDDWERRIETFELVKAPEGAVVYRSKDEPIRYVCPACAESRAIQTLQPVAKYSGSLRCPACKTVYRVDPDPPHPPLPRPIGRFV